MPISRAADNGVDAAIDSGSSGARARETPNLEEQPPANPKLDALAEGTVLGPPTPEVMPEDYRPRNREARLVHVVPPEYPEEFAGSGITAEVMLSVVVDRLGRASHVRVEDSPDDLFTDAALAALGKWEFLPKLREGKISNARMQLTVLVAEELGDRTLYDYEGGRILLENVNYAEEPETPVRRLFGLRPAYPFEMLVDRKPGEVIIECSVGEDGFPRNIRIAEATHPDFAFASHGALIHWRFSPAMRDGRAVPAQMRYRFSFQGDELKEDLVRTASALHEGRLEGVASARDIDQQPRITRRIDPSFYEGTRDSRRRRVVVEAVVTEQGDVRLPRIKSAPDELSGYMALAAVGYWHFQPAKKNRVSVAVNVELPPLVF